MRPILVRSLLENEYSFSFIHTVSFLTHLGRALVIELKSSRVSEEAPKGPRGLQRATLITIAST